MNGSARSESAESARGPLRTPQLSPSKLPLWGGFAVIVLLMVGWMHYLGLITLPIPLPQKGIETPVGPQSLVGPTPAPEKVRSLESCPVVKSGNPLVESVQVLPDGTGVGDFRGNINSVDYNATTNTAKVEVISVKGEQEHTFTLTEEAGLVYDLRAGKDATLADLKAGQVVTMSFNCYPAREENAQFKLTRVTITGTL